MPICTSCTHPIPYLYTVYESAYNLRLEQCTECHTFADPYVEHDSLTLALDLILLKRGVYRHLLYNRGSEPRKAGNVSQQQDSCSVQEKKKQKEQARWFLILRLGSAVITVDAFIRWVHINPQPDQSVSPWTADTNEPFLRILFNCFAETVAFHTGVILACAIVLNALDRFNSWKRSLSTNNAKHKPTSISGIRQEFRYSLIPLSIFYSSLIKLFLLFLLSIWRPNSNSVVDSAKSWNGTLYDNVFITRALEIFDEDKLDREWVVRNVLGGMAAGFGLRVILDCHPIFTTVIILAGWSVKSSVARLLNEWLGGDQRSWEVWLAYSIP